METLTGMFQEDDGDESWCFNYSTCTFKYVGSSWLSSGLLHSLLSPCRVLAMSPCDPTFATHQPVRPGSSSAPSLSFSWYVSCKRPPAIARHELAKPL